MIDICTCIISCIVLVIYFLTRIFKILTFETHVTCIILTTWHSWIYHVILSCDLEFLWLCYTTVTCPGHLMFIIYMSHPACTTLLYMIYRLDYSCYCYYFQFSILPNILCLCPTYCYYIFIFSFIVLFLRVLLLVRFWQTSILFFSI